ncbi:hypothetical protein FUAX_54260 (plasmid) [Fulvitalea axinellae]|uniref:DUF3575 domain-containing protein n=1 Tax=Fulvitalea axinellae TaxID=1182444 RepID=A0AAU9DEX4_9BACT|nr:hypothetical protein FUAX_54260 [Fulvitalea axinellae]
MAFITIILLLFSVVCLAQTDLDRALDDGGISKMKYAIKYDLGALTNGEAAVYLERRLTEISDRYSLEAGISAQVFRPDLFLSKNKREISSPSGYNIAFRAKRWFPVVDWAELFAGMEYQRGNYRMNGEDAWQKGDVALNYYGLLFGYRYLGYGQWIADLGCRIGWSSRNFDTPHPDRFDNNHLNVYFALIGSVGYRF